MKDDLLKPGAFLIKTHLFIPKTVAKLSKDFCFSMNVQLLTSYITFRKD